MSVNGYSAAEAFFKGEHLDIPYIPVQAKNNMKTIQPNVFGTRKDTPSLYDLDAFVREVLTKKVDDYVMLGFAGHGVSSRFMHYYTVTNHLAIFFQLSCGNIDRDKKAIRERIDGVFHSAELLFESMDEVDQEKLAEKGDRLLIVESDINGHGWGWVKGTPGKLEKNTWYESKMPYIEAMNAIPVKDLKSESENPDLLF